LPKLARFGLIVADNTLREGRIVDPREGDADTAAILRFNERVRNDERVVASLLSVRDGVTVIRRSA
jgi:caffeoyl-CoA O-methyltransferase